MSKRWYLAGLFLIVLVSFVSGAVKINEVELNPAGSNNATQWVEIINQDSLQNLSGWYIKDRDGTKVSFPSLTLSNNSLYVLDNLSLFVTNNESVFLFNNSNALQDATGNLSDSNPANGDIKTWQRIPDGTGNFFLQNGTKGILNQLSENNTLISNSTIQNTTIISKSISSQCLTETDSFLVSAQINSSCISQVYFPFVFNFTSKNLNATTNIGNTYSRIVTNGTLPSSTFMNWTVVAIDCYNRTVNAPLSQIYINARTKLSISPVNPNGRNGWYISQPTFTLTKDPRAVQSFYKWDNPIFNYTSPFGLEFSTNNGNTTGGVLNLKFWSNFNCSVEAQLNQTFKFDFQNPVFKNLEPENNSEVINNNIPTIQSLIDEIYQSNSGIDKSSIAMLLDGSNVPINVLDSGDLDAIARHNPSTLSDGIHTVKLNASDNAGRFSQTSWSFKINTTIEDFSINISSPINNSYNSRRIPLEIKVSQMVDKIELRDNLAANPRPRLLCRNCDEYGISREKIFSFHEGLNNITIKATDEFGNFRMKTRVFFIDSRPPKISSTEPKRESVINGSFFQVKYSEDNLKSVMLSFNQSINLTNCPSGNNRVCNVSTNLSLYNNHFIDYKFILSDGINTAESKTTRVLVDTINPLVTINSPTNTSQARKVQLNISIPEQVNLEYMDNFDFSPRMRSLCIDCIDYGQFKPKFISLKSGHHDLIFKATDEAGNTDMKEVEFDVI